MPFTGYQQAHGYHFRQTEEEQGEPVTRIFPRALMVPPGIPEFFTRERTVPAGRCTIEGRAWSGHAPIASLEVSTDDGASWQLAALGPAEYGPFAWRRWTFDWDAVEPGRHVLASRARDESGREQPSAPDWNLGGYANNSCQRVVVTVS